MNVGEADSMEGNDVGSSVGREEGAEVGEDMAGKVVVFCIRTQKWSYD